ncbi:hypothetical protein amad1_13130 [Alteromonas mediterranea DE1]|uniref:Uncharacterized protein n=2 Tax=Alteromonas TaxID=226 RepID=A0AAC8XKE2_9ALTE|nr:hypothetical protein amad1_13130 [Alteromonas mediterranea DE1]AGF95368.1 hypothetical protein A910_00030 [uncultured Alteromonas sp.]AGP98137.1 hypothetical protein I635_13110 [Alteromonas mediterranea UM7]AGQ02396.1 hypothetical protein I636_12745 [Alteromonas mediterranea UM4b]AMJ79138.1 hypothetical protein AV942_12925 [Alteromonas mediterranea]
MLKVLILLILIIFYTYLLKRRFNVKMMNTWQAETLGSEVLVYVMIALPVVLAWLTTTLFEYLFF